MADTNPRRPHPGQQYTHGWKPVTPQAAVVKNHGRKVKANSAVARLLQEASASHKRMQQQDADRKAGKTPDMTVPKGAPTRSAAAKAGQPRGPESQKAEDALRAALGRKTAAPQPEKKAETPAPTKAPEKPAAKKPAKAPKEPTESEKTAKALDYAKKLKPSGKKVGEDSRGNPLKIGDEVKITVGPNAGKTGKVAGKGKSGAVLVDTGEGDPVSMSPANLSSASSKGEREAPQAKQDAPAKPARDGKGSSGSSKGPYGIDLSAPQATQIKQTEDAIRKAFDDLDDERNAAGWLPMLALRNALPGVSREVQDAALMKLLVQPDVRIAENSTRFWSSDEAKEAALDVLGSPNDQIMILNPDGSVKRNGKPSSRTGKDSSPSAETKPSGPSGSKISDTEAQDRIIDAVGEITAKGSWGTMAQLRDKLGGMDRQQQDRLIADMMLEGKLDLVSASNPGGLTQQERDAAIAIGSTPNHRVRLGDKKHTRQSPSPKTEPDTPAEKPAQSGSDRKVSDAQVESEVLDALKRLPGPNGSRWNSMGQIRDALKGIPRKQQDAVIRQMMLDGKVDIEPVAIYNNLPQKERDAEIMIGPTPNHQIRLSR